jgi:hypothetical protein
MARPRCQSGSLPDAEELSESPEQALKASDANNNKMAKRACFLSARFKVPWFDGLTTS